MNKAIKRRAIPRLHAAARLVFNCAVELLESGYQEEGLALMEAKDVLHDWSYYIRTGKILPERSAPLPSHSPPLPHHVGTMPPPPPAMPLHASVDPTDTQSLPRQGAPPPPERPHVAASSKSTGCGVCFSAAAAECGHCLETPTTREGAHTVRHDLKWEPVTRCRQCGHVERRDFFRCNECGSTNTTCKEELV